MATEKGEASRSFPCWVGTVSDYERVVEAVQKALVAPQVSALSAFDDETKRELETADSLFADIYSARRAEDRIAVEAKWAVELRTIEDRFLYETRGSPEEILGNADWRTTRELRLTGPIDVLSRKSVSLRFSRHDDVQLAVSGDERAWLTSTVEAVENELRKGVPWWGALRGTRVYYALTLVLVAMSWAGIYIVYKSSSSLGINDEILLDWLNVLGLWAVSWGARALVRKSLLGFEFIQPGQTPSGRKAVNIVCTTAGSVLISALVALIVH